MSRLIDAEALKKTFCAECDHTISCEDCDIDFHFEHLAPAVEAIPIRWLQEWGYKHFANYYHNISFETVIDGAINDYRKWWREEQSDGYTE